MTTNRFVSCLVALLGAMASGCGSGANEPLNVLLITLDTTRADHLGCYGKESARTPNLDSIAAEGVRFDRCFSAAPVTTPSHSTIFTGTYPPHHGVRDNGMFVLGPDSVTFAEIAKQHGYTTGGAVGSFPVTRGFGLAQGFDFFDDRISAPAEDFRGQRTVPKQGVFFEERPAPWVNTAILPWFEDNVDRPFFVWLHYWDPHLPHHPPPPYSEIFAHDLYSGEIAYADHSLGTILELLKRSGVWDRTVVVVIGDHGEGNGEHGEDTHSMLAYNTTIRVPFLMRVPGRFAGTVVDQPVGSVDIVPTLVELLGLELPDGVQGRSLLPMLENDDGAGGENHRYYAEALSPRLSHGWGELRVLVAEPYKYIHGPRPELYNVFMDPNELDNLVDELPEVAAAMKGELAELIVELGASAAGVADVVQDEETLMRLEALGYLSSGGDQSGLAVEELRSDGEAPQDRVGDIALMSRTKNSIDERDYLAARESARLLVEKDPGSAYYRSLLATAYLGLGEGELALEVMEEVESLPSLTAGVALDIGVAAFNIGERERGEAMIRRYLAERPSAYGYYLLAEMRAAVGDDAGYAASLEKALELDPTNPKSLLSSAVRFASLGQTEKAERDFRKLLESNPHSLRGHYNFGVLLLQESRWDDARLHLDTAVELGPDYWPAHLALMAMYVDLGDAQAAGAERETIRNRCTDDRVLKNADDLMELL